MNYIFGSWFDPFTHAHEAIIKAVKKKMHANDKLYILVADNDEKSGRTPAEIRKEMVKTALAAKNIRYELDIQKVRMYEYLWLYFRDCDPKDITIVIGDDEWKNLQAGKWFRGNQLLTTYNFLVFARDGLVTYSRKTPCPTVDSVDFNDVSSSAVREIFRTNPECHYKDVQKYISKVVFNFIRKEGKINDKNEIVTDCLYNQNPTNYAVLMKKWIDNYKKQGWGKFANTVDIVAYNDNKILLIRRKNCPYRNFFALPGGFFDPVDINDKETNKIIKADIDLEHAAQRELYEETNLNIPIEKFIQIKTYSHIFDPRLRIIDTAFAVKISTKNIKQAFGNDDALEAAWFDINNLPKLAFHHEQIINDWLSKKYK